MKRIGAVAVAVTAFAAAGASAQTAGTVHVVTTPDATACVASSGGVTALRSAEGLATFQSFAGERPTVVAVARGEHLDKMALEKGTVATARIATLTEHGAAKYTMTRSADGAVTVVDGDGNPVDLKELKHGADGTVSFTSTDGKIALRSSPSKTAGVYVGAEGGVVVDEKEAPKYHVKRPSPNKARTVEGTYVYAADGAAAGEMRARVLAADGVALAKPAECRVIVRDGGNNW